MLSRSILRDNIFGQSSYLNRSFEISNTSHGLVLILVLMHEPQAHLFSYPDFIFQLSKDQIQFGIKYMTSLYQKIVKLCCFPKIWGSSSSKYYNKALCKISLLYLKRFLRYVWKTAAKHEFRLTFWPPKLLGKKLIFGLTFCQ